LCRSVSKLGAGHRILRDRRWSIPADCKARVLDGRERSDSQVPVDRPDPTECPARTRGRTGFSRRGAVVAARLRVPGGMSQDHFVRQALQPACRSSEVALYGGRWSDWFAVDRIRRVS
jgi:hypothetical protein